jgi:hypothetical protein
VLARQQPQRWQLKHLPGLDPDHHCTGQLGAAPLAAVRHMPDHLVGLGDLGQMGTGRAGLLARGAAALGLLGTALPGPRGLSKAIRGRRLGGVGGVLAQAALQLRHPGLQRHGKSWPPSNSGLRPACHGPRRERYTAVVRAVKPLGTSLV